MKLLNGTLLLIGIVSLTSCASYFKRKECEKTNWYQHGYDIAMRGERTDSDGFLKECTKVEAAINYAELDTGFKSGMGNYCKEEMVSKRGQDGEYFNTDFCDPNQVRKLKELHSKGVKKHCAKENGYRVGASGKTYNNICPEDLVKDWLPEYNRGRKVYLRERINNAEREISDIDNDLRSEERELSYLQGRLRSMPLPSIAEQRIYDSNTNSYRTVRDEARFQQLQNQRDEVQAELNMKQSAISEKRGRQASLRKSIGDYRLEMNTLE